MKALVLAGGRLKATTEVDHLLEGVGLVVAADSGLRHARRLGLHPDAIVGDFDSVAVADLESFPEVPQLRHPIRKDQLDLELALDLARARGASQVVVLGAFGDRLDQSFAALLIAARLRRDGLLVSLHDGERDAYPLRAGDRLEIDLPVGRVFSLLALEPTVVSVRGSAYELREADLRPGTGVGVSNVAGTRPAVEVHRGLLLLIAERTVHGHEIADLG